MRCGVGGALDGLGAFDLAGWAAKQIVIYRHAEHSRLCARGATPTSGADRPLRASGVRQQQAPVCRGTRVYSDNLGVARPVTDVRDAHRTCNFAQPQAIRRANMTPMAFPDNDLVRLNRRIADARERLDLQRERLRALWSDRRDTNDAEAVFRALRRTVETFEGRRHRIEDELLRAANVPTRFG